MLSKNDRQYKFELYGRPMTALKLYYNVFLPLIIARWFVVIITNINDVNVEPLIFIKDIVFIILAVASCIFVRQINNLGQTFNLIFLIYWPITSAAEYVKTVFFTERFGPAHFVNTNQSNAVTNMFASTFSAVSSMILVFETLFFLVSAAFCIFYIVYLINHTALFYKNLARLQKEFDR